MTARGLEVLWPLCVAALESGDFQRGEQLLREILAADPDNEAAASDLGRLLLHLGRSHEAAACFERVERARSGPETITRVLSKRLLDFELASRRAPYFIRLENVLVDTAYWSIMKDDVVYSDDTMGLSLYNSPWVRGRMSGKTVVASYPTPRVAVETECIFVGGDPNYSHWLFRNLLKLCSLAPAGLVDRLPWLVNDDLRPHQEEYLALLGIPAERLIRVERNQVMRARALVVPALLTNASTIPAGLAWIRGRLSSQMTPPAAATRRVYVSRRDARQRALLNEDELYAALAPLGFEFFVPGEASVAEQIRVFSGAQLIVAVHGAALTNIVFSPPTASVIEITNSAMRDMDDMRRLAASCGQRMETIVCDRYPAHAAPIHVNSDYYVDIAGVLQAVDRALA